MFRVHSVFFFPFPLNISLVHFCLNYRLLHALLYKHHLKHLKLNSFCLIPKCSCFPSKFQPFFFFCKYANHHPGENLMQESSSPRRTLEKRRETAECKFIWPRCQKFLFSFEIPRFFFLIPSESTSSTHDPIILFFTPTPTKSAHTL